MADPQQLEPLNEEETKLLEEYSKLYGLGSGFPKAEEKQGMFQIFNKIIDTTKSSKVANFTAEDLMNVRLFLSAANYAETNGLSHIAKYLKNESEIYAATSLGFKAKLLEAVITQKRESKTKVGEHRKKPWFGPKAED